MAVRARYGGSDTGTLLETPAVMSLPGIILPIVSRGAVSEVHERDQALLPTQRQQIV